MRRILILLLAALLALRCATAPRVAQPVPARGDLPTVVLVPGMTGSRLCSKSTGELLWGDSTRLVRPWDGGYRLARPLDGGEDDVVPCGAIREMRVAQWRKDIYGGLIAFLTGHGIDLHVFDHDWRRDNVDNARLLAARLQPMQRVNLICQSNAAYICRYLVKYGDVSIDDAERGIRRPPKNVEKVILIGNANGGAIRILEELNRGRQYIRVVGRRWRPEMLFTFPSLYQDLPVYRRDVADVDLFDPGNWKKYQWSIYAPGPAKRALRFGTQAELDAFLADALRDAQRMHRLLRHDGGTPLPRYYSIQSRDFPTPSRARIIGSRTVFRDTVPGDRHATEESQRWLSPEESAVMEALIRVKGRHFEMITTDETRAHLLRIVTGR